MQTSFKYSLALVVSLVLIVGCSGPAAQNTPATTTSHNAAPTGTTAADPLQAIANSVHSFGAITSYRMAVVVEGGTPSQTSTLKIEIAGKNYHFLSSRGTEFYLIGDTFYLKQNAKAQWRKLPSDSPEASGVTAALLAPKESLTSAIAAHNATLSGTDVIDGKPMLVYQYTLIASPSKLWVVRPMVCPIEWKASPKQEQRPP